MLTVVTAATAANLTTLERARAMLDFAPTEDAAVSTLIDQASRVIADYCRRPFGLETVRETFDAFLWGSAVLLSRSPVIAITEVLDGTQAIDIENTRQDAETGLLYRIDDDGYPLCWSGARLTVTYSAGYVLPSDEDGAPATTLPEPVERAAIRLVGAYRSLSGRDQLIKSETVEGIGSTSWWVPGAGSVLADPEAEQLLQPYRRLF
ncbi:hypothetical protein [Jiella sonneratiae]|uniref:Phage gp6-like head-tail connector protein n=1 Tax=Jiella sonneratiae TaxID=2816856 RepID=A0ABS3J3H3_9HYPH|nr:hypothetical protein [Jiella sonneratiae]MBO0904220.1 hypothetical protein [Jiella sonneratiae]